MEVMNLAFQVIKEMIRKKPTRGGGDQAEVAEVFLEVKDVTEEELQLKALLLINTISRRLS